MKSKFLSKKWLVWLLAVMLIVLSITGCSGKDDDDDDDKDSKSKKELSLDDEDEDDDEDDDEDEKKKDDEEEPTPEPEVEATPEPTAEPTPEPTEEPAAETDWETAYEDYFETWGPLVEENAVVIVSGYEGDLYAEMAYGYSGEYSAFSMEVGEAYFELITDPDNIYYYSEAGDNYEWAVTPRDASTDADFLGMAESMSEMIDDIEYDYYYDYEEYDENEIYDLVACYVDYDGEECEALAYINRETQNMEYLELEDTDGNYVDIEILFPGEDGIMEMLVDTIEEYDGVDEVTFDEMGNMVINFMFTMLSGVETDDTNGTEDITGTTEDITGTDVEDWSGAYDNFFDNGITIPEQFEITTQIDLGGIVLDYEVLQDGVLSLVKYRIGEYGVDAYTDGTVIVMENIGLDGSEWVYAEIESGSDMAEVLGADFTELMGGVTDSVSSAVYVEAVEEDGVVYDVMEIDGDGTLVYINREKQIVSKMTVESDGLVMECKFDGVTGFDIPAEAANATGMTKDELANYYQEAIVESVYASMGMEY